MKDMMIAKKKELEERGYKGFTLMEMLIVIAIIAVLVAIAIPIFTTQLETAREATDIANVRSAYAYVMTEYLTKPGSGVSMTVEPQQEQAGWQGSSGTLVVQKDGSQSNVSFEAKRKSDGSYSVSITNSGDLSVN